MPTLRRQQNRFFSRLKIATRFCILATLAIQSTNIILKEHVTATKLLNCRETSLPT